MRRASHPTVSDEPVETAIAALSAGFASLNDLSDAVAARRAQRPAIGQLLLTRHKLSVHQVFQILSEQVTDSRLFGEIAIDRGFLRASDIDEMLRLQSSLCPSLLSVLESRNVVTPDQAATLRQQVQSRLRESAEPVPVICEV